ncbi:MAG: hypothetical protein ACK56I_29140, partial [bacterium]
SANRAIAAQGRPLLPAEQEDRDQRRHEDLREKCGVGNPHGRVVGAEILPERRHALPLAATAAVGPVEGREEHRDRLEHAPLDRQARRPEEDLRRDQERHRE